MKKNKMRRLLMAEIKEHNPDAKIMSDHDNAILGMVIQKGSKTLVLYDPLKIIDNLMLGGEMTYDDAVEFYEYNIADAYVGEDTPAFLIRLDNLGHTNESKLEENK